MLIVNGVCYTGSAADGRFLVFCDKTGVAISHESQPLVLHQWYNSLHDWRTETGRRQLALDLLIDYFEESPTDLDLRQRELQVAAWLPHLDYATYLESIRTSTNWSIDREALHVWFVDWAEEKHRERGRRRYGEHYGGYPYSLWIAQLDELLSRAAYRHIDITRFTTAYRVVVYTAGMTPQDLVAQWLLRIVEGLPTNLGDEL